MISFRGYGMAVEFYHLSKGLRMERHLKEQWGRACSSIALNLAEGYGKRTPKDRTHYYLIALGSLRECQAILDLSSVENKSVSEMANRLGGALYKLVNH
jgi:four helix bundle protein